jgi:hypothetical protein
VGACSLETNVEVIFREGIDEQPVGFDMAITATSKITPERVILEELRQWTSVNQQFQDSLQLGQASTRLLGGK